MDIKRCKRLVVSLFIITICLCILPLYIHASSRGITIKAKTSSGAVKEIQLYSGYHALVVGVSDYDKWPDLPYATKDAQDVAGALKKMGFTVKTIINPSSRALTKALNDLAYKYGRESNRAILLYYAGHGETEKLADGTKLGYIIPKDCPLLRDDPEGFVNNAISMKDIEAYSLRIRSKHVLMLFDSCFSGSLFSLVRAVPEDITEKSTLPVRQYITAGTEDEAVPDRSMFKRCLLLGLEGDADLTRDGYITGTELGLYLSDKVIQNTRRAQHPQYGKIRTPELARGDFIFRLASSVAVIGPVTSKTVILPKESKTSFDDILKAEEAEHQAKEKWGGWQKTRETEYRKIKKIDESNNLTSKQKTVAWQRFLAAVSQDNPYSLQDNEMRTYSRSRLNHWQSVKPPVTKPAKESPKLAMGKKPSVAPKRSVKNSLGMEFVYIKPGTFMMGSPPSEPGRSDNEEQHRVTLSKGFYIQTTEVTQGQWKEVMGSNPSKFKNCGDDCPVENVSWKDVQEFIRKLNQREINGTYRLPAEEEWEYAARAGTDTPFSFGRCLSTDQANYKGSPPLSGCSKGENRKKTIPVASFQPNSWGLYDMHGNVVEWCQDRINHRSRRVSGRAYRGGSWIDDAKNCRSAFRSYRLFDQKDRYIGFRLFRTTDSFDEKVSSDANGTEIKRDGSFIAYSNGVVYDKRTWLEWYVGPDKNTSWIEAKRWVEGLSVAGGGWRMPTREELKTLYKRGAGERNMTPLLKNTGWWVWSFETKGSSLHEGLNFNHGPGNWSFRNFSVYTRGFAVRSRR